MGKKHSTSKTTIDVDDLHKQLSALKLENARLSIIIRENGLDVEEEVKQISDTEAICSIQIKRLKDKSLYTDFTEADSKILDILHKNLRLSRGQIIEKDNSRKTKKMSTDQLLELVKDV